jgi:hypothetical protein
MLMTANATSELSRTSEPSCSRIGIRIFTIGLGLRPPDDGRTDRNAGLSWAGVRAPSPQTGSGGSSSRNRSSSQTQTRSGERLRWSKVKRQERVPFQTQLLEELGGGQDRREGSGGRLTRVVPKKRPKSKRRRRKTSFNKVSGVAYWKRDRRSWGDGPA